jgi:NAD(P)H-flavin reductase
MYTVRLSHIDEVNPTVRLIQLAIPPHVQSLEGQEERADGESDQPQPLTFLPGQWVDVHIPGLADAGGYSITSTPADAQVLPSPGPPVESPMDEETGLPPMDPRGRAPYLELAVQHAPSNPASAWLWRPKDEIQGQELSIRIGGSFVWPPSGINLDETKKVLFIAGGVGIKYAFLKSPIWK